MSEQQLSAGARDAYADHDEVALLLCWYVTGSLEADDRTRVERHCAVCLLCRADLEIERRLAGAVADADLAVADMRQGRARLEARFASTMASRPGAVPAARESARWAVAAVLVVAAGLVWLIASSSQSGIKRGDDFRTLATAPAAGAHVRELVVVFAPDVDGEEADALAAGVDGHLLPSTLRPGVRRVRVHSTDDGAVDAAVAALKASGRVIFAEPAVKP